MRVIVETGLKERKSIFKAEETINDMKKKRRHKQNERSVKKNKNW